MMSQTLKNHNKSIKILGAILISLLFISTVTAVPQTSGKPIMDQINQKEELEQMVEQFSEEMNDPQQEISPTLLNFLLNILMNILGKYFDISAITDILNSILGGVTDGANIQTIVDILLSLFQNSNGADDPPADNTLLNIIISIFKTLITLIASLFKILINASVGVIGGIIKIISAIFTMILLIIAGTQTFFTLGAVLMLFLGVMSKIGIKALSVIGAPIFALIAIQLCISFGTILSGISTTIFSALSIILLLALPLAFVGIIVFLIGGIDIGGGEGLNLDLDFDRTGLLYMLLSILSSKITPSA